MANNIITNINIARVKTNRDVPQHAHDMEVAYILVGALKKLGKIYKNNDQLFFFEDLTKQLHSIPENREPNSTFQHFLVDKLNFSMHDKGARGVYERVFVKCQVAAIDANVYDFFYTDKSKNRLYFRVSNSRLGILSAKELSYADNGTDGVIFKTNNWSADLPEVQPEQTADLFLDFIGNIWFSDLPNYSVKAQRFMTMNWFLYSIIESQSTARPILVYEGERGTGKTSTLLAFGKLLFGSNYSADEVPHDIRDFHSSLLNNEFIIIDNFDERAPDQFIDQLTRLTTGGGINRRPLYKDVGAEPIREIVKCSIAITTRTAVFNRDDLVDRSIPCRLINKKDDINMRVELHKHVESNRDKYWASLLSYLQTVLANLTENKGMEFKSRFRMVDFERFCYESSSLPVERVSANIEQMIDYQVDFEAMNNRFIEVFEEMVENKGITYGVRYTTEEVHQIINSYAPVTTSVQHTGNSMSKYERLLSRYVEISRCIVSDDNGKRKRGWIFKGHNTIKEESQEEEGLF